MTIELDEVTVFLAIVDAGSLTAAAESLGQPVSSVSRLLARLEEKLQTTLLQRTTRRLALTDEGCGFVKDARQIASAVQAAEDRLMLRKGRLSGPLRIDASTPFLLHVLVPLVAGYRAQHPLVELQLSSNEGFIDLLERRVDLALRIGPLKDSSLHSRLLGHSAQRVLASPAYLEKNGMPLHVSALQEHSLLGFTQPDSLNYWPLRVGAEKRLHITPTLACSNGETLRQLALQGQGLVCLADFMTLDDMAQGRLVPVLGHVTEPTTQPIHAVYYQHSAVSARVASMVTYLAQALRSTPWLLQERRKSHAQAQS